MIRCILSDIEGTTSSIEFVHKVLFPYSRARLETFLAKTEDQEARAAAQYLWTEELGGAKGQAFEAASVAKLLASYIDADKKDPSLKVIQGKIWKEGFEAGDYRGHVYGDVRPALEKWKGDGLTLAIYSSGSVESQKLLFGFSEAGDLAKLFSAHFDTAVGHKREKPSYEAIAQQLKLKADEILFLSDIKEELDAAAAAGMKVVQLLRDPMPALGTHPKAKTFTEVDSLLKSL